MRSADTTEARPLAQRLGVILWPSFLLAGIATMVLFAFVDPVELHAISFPEWEFGRTAGYTIGFFSFWLLTSISCAMTCYFRRPMHRPTKPHIDS